MIGLRIKLHLFGKLCARLIFTLFFATCLLATSLIFIYFIGPSPILQAQNSAKRSTSYPGSKTEAVSQPDPPPYWAYVQNTPASSEAASTKPADDALLHVPNSDIAFRLAQIQNLFYAPDWHPDGHPAAPSIVAIGRAPEVYACGYCHLPNGQGRPENASLSGLPAGYIVQQVSDFKSGARQCSERGIPHKFMVEVATKANQDEIRAAAEYFSALKPARWIRVIETDTVPKTHAAGFMLVPTEGGETEPIGHRIIETPELVELTELRDDHSGFIAYVPLGSIKKGQALVTTGAGKTVACSTCHGPDLKGMGLVPRLAGRSPSYLVRQLYDIQSGSRTGLAVQKMKPAVAKLSLDDMIAITAYLASLGP